MTLQSEPATTHPVRVFTDALLGEPCTVHGLGDLPQRLAMTRWSATADAGDVAVLAHCTGPTLDIGCGPGRMSEHLAERGVDVLGIDIVPEAVAQTQARGARALHRDVFDHLPGEGRWVCALLADGNIGIGGDPVALLGRVAAVLAPRGWVVADVAPPGTAMRTHTISLQCGGHRSDPFPWTVLGTEAVNGVAHAAGLSVAGVHEHEGRWFVVLAKTS
ncbi:MAG: methyltransferase domain-containing protein [Nocardioidaceae bacterium]